MKDIIEKIKNKTIAPKDVIALPPDQRYLILGTLALRAKEYKKALEYLERTNLPLANKLKAYALFALGRFKEVIAILEKEEKKGTSEYMFLFFSHLIEGSEKEAKRYLSIALELDKKKAINMLKSFVEVAKESKKAATLKRLIELLG